MVIIACLISNGYDVLVCNSLDPFEKTPYMLPESSAESIESIEVAQKNITERLGSKQILFDFDEILYETNEDGLCHQVLYLCHAYQWTNQAEDNSYGWIEVRKLTSNPFSSAYKELSNAANDYLTRREKILSKIRSEIETIHDQSQVKIEIGEQVDIIVFWLRHSKIYVPFCLEVEYFLKRDESVDFHIRWKASRQYAPGDKSDLYMLFTETMALLLKLFNEPVYVSTYNFLGLEPEINGAEIIFEGTIILEQLLNQSLQKRLLTRLNFLTFFLAYMEEYLVQFPMTLSMRKIYQLSNTLVRTQITSSERKVVVTIIQV